MNQQLAIATLDGDVILRQGSLYKVGAKGEKCELANLVEPKGDSR